MKKNTIQYVLWYFSRYTNNLFIDYEILVEILTYCKDDLYKVFSTFDEIGKNFSSDYVFTYYLLPFFHYKEWGVHTSAINLTEFLQYAIGEYENFIDDIENEIY